MIGRLDAARVLPRITKYENTSPIYLQIAATMRKCLGDGALAVGVLLPPERVLCAHFRVSRMTLREACRVLEVEGLIERQRGRGTFVASPRVRKQQQDMRSFTEELSRRGIRASSKLLSFQCTVPPAEVREFFGIPEGEEVYEIRRLRYGNGIPLALEFVQIPCYLCRGLERFDLTSVSLYSLLENQFGLDLVHCIEEVRAEVANRSQKKLLGLQRPAVLVIDRRTYTNNETPAEIAVTVYRGDHYRAVVHAVRHR